MDELGQRWGRGCDRQTGPTPLRDGDAEVAVKAWRTSNQAAR